MVSVTSASRYVSAASRYLSNSSMYIRGVIVRNSTELDEAVPINVCVWYHVSYAGLWSVTVTFLGHILLSDLALSQT